MNAQMTDEQVKAVMDLYKPNFIQKLFMRYFSHIETTNIVRNTSVALAIGIFGLGCIFSSIAEVIVGLAIGLPIVAGMFYNNITNKKRVEQLMGVLSATEAEVNTLEVKYYLA
jgi:hypothetical protein